MHTVYRASYLHTNIATITLLLASLLWLLSGCMTQSVHDDSASPVRADRHVTKPPPKVVVSPAPAEPNKPKSRLDLPKYDTQATVKKSKPVTKTRTKAKPSQPASTTVTPRKAPAFTRVDIMHLDLESLPLSFGTQWSLDRRLNPVTKKTQCILTSETVNIPDGYATTDVQVLLTFDSIYVSADSNIDLKYPGTGIRIGEDTLHPFDRLFKETTAIVSGDDVPALYARMASSPGMVVSLGFWPTWPITETRSVSYTLADFQTAILALRACNRM